MCYRFYKIVALCFFYFVTAILIFVRHRGNSSTAVKMPLPNNEELNKLARETVDTMRATFDTPKNYRPGKQSTTSTANQLTNVSPRKRPTLPRNIHPEQRSTALLQSTNIQHTINATYSTLQHRHRLQRPARQWRERLTRIRHTLSPLRRRTQTLRYNYQ